MPVDKASDLFYNRRLRDEWNLVQAGSRFLSDAETQYAVIELECLLSVGQSPSVEYS